MFIKMQKNITCVLNVRDYFFKWTKVFQNAYMKLYLCVQISKKYRNNTNKIKCEY